MTVLLHLGDDCHEFRIGACLLREWLSVEVLQVLEVFTLYLWVDILTGHLFLALHIHVQLVLLIHFNCKDVGTTRVIGIIKSISHLSGPLRFHG